MKALVIAGAWSQVMLINQLKERGIEAVLLDNNPNATAVPYADKFIQVNIMDVVKLYAHVKGVSLLW